jgi:hypothetical protein
MRLEFSGCCFWIVIECFRPGPELNFRRYRVGPQDAAVRRRLLRDVRKKRKEVRPGDA